MVKTADEIKVGVVSLFALGLFLYFLFALQGIKVQQEGYNLRITFKSAAGLTEKSPVRLAGIKVGEVQELYLNNRTNKVVVVVRIGKKIKVKENALFLISTDSLLALEKYIEIVPGLGKEKYLKDNAEVAGEDPVEAQELLTGFKNSLNQVQGISHSLQKVLGDESLYRTIKETLVNVSLASVHILKLTENIATITTNSQQDIYAIVKNFKSVSENLNVASAKLSKLSQDKQITQDLKDTLENLKKTSESASHISKKLEKDLFTKENIQEMQNTLKEGKKLVQNTNKIIEKINKSALENPYKITTSLDAGYKTKAEKIQTNVNFEISSKKSPYFFYTGVEDVSEGNKINLQMGKKLNKNLKTKVGFVSGKPGIGIIYSKNKMSLTGEVYDPNNLYNKALAEYKINKSLYFVFGWYKDVKKNGNGWIGIKVKK